MKTRWWIIASGPSLIKKDVELLISENVCVINNNYQLAPWAKILYFCDPHWWEWHKEEIKNFKGQIWTQDKATAKDYRLNWKESKPGMGIEDNGPIFQGGNSGIQAINLIWQLFKPEQIILLGYDMKGTNDKPHWFGHHPNNIVSGWNTWVPYYGKVAEDAKRLGLEIINCTRDTALTCFPRKSLEEVL